MLRVVLAAVFALIVVGSTGAIPPDKDKDSAAKAKAILALSSPSPECPIATKAKSALASSGLPVAPMPSLKHVSTPTPAKMDTKDCLDDACHPVVPGFVRGADGVYRQSGIVPARERR